jgi:hypothetical protein
MSRHFNGSSQYGVAAYSIGATPLTLCAWVKAGTTAGGGKCLVALCGTTAFHYQLLGLSTALGKWYCASRAGGSELYVASTTAPTTSAWVHLAAVFPSAATREIFVNGVSEGSGSGAATVSPARFSIAVRTDGGIPAASPSYYEGDLADVCAFDVALSARQVASLAAGASPLMVARGNLRMYAPLWGEASTEPNFRGVGFTLTGSPTKGASRPRVFLP